MSSTTILALSSETAVPFEVSVSRNGGQTGLTVTVRLRDAETTDSYVDFADGTFKTVGWTTQTRTLTEVGDGFYSLAEDFSAITFPHLRRYVAEYQISGTVTEVVADIYALEDTIEDTVWDAILTGATHNISTSAGRRLRQVQEEQGYENGAVYIDTVNGTAGITPFENGTVGNPVNTLADAITIANDSSVNLKRFIVRAGSSITLVAALDGFTIGGPFWTLAMGGQSISGSLIVGATVSGVAIGAAPPTFRDCFIEAVTLPPCTLIACAIDGMITVGSAGDFFLDQCYSGKAGTAAPIFDFASVGAEDLHLRHYSGGIELENMVATDVMSLEGHGQLIINANCTGGSVSVRGHFPLTDNASGAVTVTGDYLFDVRRALYNRLDIDDSTNELILYDDDGTTVLQRWDLTDKDGSPIVLAGTDPANRGAPKV